MSVCIVISNFYTIAKYYLSFYIFCFIKLNISENYVGTEYTDWFYEIMRRILGNFFVSLTFNRLLPTPPHRQGMPIMDKDTFFSLL